MAHAGALSEHHDASSIGNATQLPTAEQPAEAPRELSDAAAALEAAVAGGTAAALQAAIRTAVAALSTFTGFAAELREVMALDNTAHIDVPKAVRLWRVYIGK